VTSAATGAVTSAVVIRHDGQEHVFPLVYTGPGNLDALEEVIGQMVTAVVRLVKCEHRRSLGEPESHGHGGVNLGFEVACASGDFDRARARAEAIIG